MVLITPYRPLVAPVPQTQPHQVNSAIGSVDVVGFDTVVEAPPASRQTILESHFGGGFNAIKNRFDWQFCTLVADSNGKIPVVADAGTMNGWGSSDITFPAGALPNCRAFGNLYLPLISGHENGYEEGWMTVDIMYRSNFSCPKGLKQPGLYSTVGEGLVGGPFPTCDTGWSCRYMAHGEDRSTNSEPLGAHSYYYWTNDDRVRADWSPEYELDLDTVCRIELYFKHNTAFDQLDGIIRHKFDTGTSTASATPDSIRFENTGIRMYCGSESNRVPSYVNRISCHLFFGGATSAWAPLINSTFRIGRVAFEIPA